MQRLQIHEMLYKKRSTKRNREKESHGTYQLKTILLREKDRVSGKKEKGRKDPVYRSKEQGRMHFGKRLNGNIKKVRITKAHKFRKTGGREAKKEWERDLP